MSISALRRAGLPPIPLPVYEVCWNLLGLGAKPFPLVVLGHSAEGTGQAGRWLSEHGLGTEVQVGPELADALRLIDDFEVELALVYADETGQTRVGCFVRGTEGLRTVLRGDEVELSWIDPQRLAESALGAVPERAAALVPEPRAAADDAAPSDFFNVYSTATAFGRATSVLRTRDRLGTRLSEVPVTWLDTPNGRYSITTADGQLTLSPACAAKLLDALAALLD